jgi:hypothetical protein
MPNLSGAPIGVEHASGSPEMHVRQIVDRLNYVIRGKLNCTGWITLQPNVATTYLTDPRISTLTAVLLMPASANAAAALTNVWFVTGKGTVGINHVNNAQTDRVFRYALIG